MRYNKELPSLCGDFKTYIDFRASYIDHNTEQIPSERCVTTDLI